MLESLMNNQEREVISNKEKARDQEGLRAITIGKNFSSVLILFFLFF
jgi:hypothetical protein|tara:strand:- start:42 stop:182 length:141 start_codon:yes stop_codon:yes gene_type:complete